MKKLVKLFSFVTLLLLFSTHDEGCFSHLPDSTNSKCKTQKVIVTADIISEEFTK